MGEQQGLGAGARRRRRGFAAGMAAADDNDVEICHAPVHTRILGGGQSRLLSDTKIPEHQVQQFLDIDLAGDAADGAQCQAQIFGEQFGLILRRRKRMAQTGQRLDKRRAMARPGEGRRFTFCFQPFRDQCGERSDQFRQALAAFQRQRQAIALLESAQDRFCSRPPDRV